MISKRVELQEAETHTVRIDLHGWTTVATDIVLSVFLFDEWLCRLFISVYRFDNNQLVS
jgi:hypothetical protein